MRVVGPSSVTWGSLVASRRVTALGCDNAKLVFALYYRIQSLAVGKRYDFEPVADEFSNCSSSRYRHVPIDKDAIPRIWVAGRPVVEAKQPAFFKSRRVRHRPHLVESLPMMTPRSLPRLQPLPTQKGIEQEMNLFPVSVISWFQGYLQVVFLIIGHDSRYRGLEYISCLLIGTEINTTRCSLLAFLL